jgi:RES domain-containing protein
LTLKGRQLDPEFLLSPRPLFLYRLARARYANLSGIGAAMAPGRWNALGQEAIYTSTELGVPILERLVHTPKNLIPSNLALMKIRVTGTWVMSRNALIDRHTDSVIFCYGDIAEAKRELENNPLVAGAVGALALAVPSVIVPVWNVVLYPKGVGFWEHVSLEGVEPFEFDPRLFPENAAAEV